jgi:hypothetical protein
MFSSNMLSPSSVLTFQFLTAVCVAAPHLPHKHLQCHVVLTHHPVTHVVLIHHPATHVVLTHHPVTHVVLTHHPVTHSVTVHSVP